jgi:hypothetical protein
MFVILRQWTAADFECVLDSINVLVWDDLEYFSDCYGYGSVCLFNFNLGWTGIY